MAIIKCNWSHLTHFLNLVKQIHGSRKQGGSDGRTELVFVERSIFHGRFGSLHSRLTHILGENLARYNVGAGETIVKADAEWNQLTLRRLLRKPTINSRHVLYGWHVREGQMNCPGPTQLARHLLVDFMRRTQ